MWSFLFTMIKIFSHSLNLLFHICVHAWMHGCASIVWGDSFLSTWGSCWHVTSAAWPVPFWQAVETIKTVKKKKKNLIFEGRWNLAPPLEFTSMHWLFLLFLKYILLSWWVLAFMSLKKIYNPLWVYMWSSLDNTCMIYWKRPERNVSMYLNKKNLKNLSPRQYMFLNIPLCSLRLFPLAIVMKTG